MYNGLGAAISVPLSTPRSSICTKHVRVNTGAELNIALLRMVEYLGHENPFIKSVAYDEVSMLDRKLRATIDSC